MTVPRPTPSSRFAVAAALLLALLAACALAAPAGAAQRAPIRDCGDISTLDDGGAYLGAVTAQRANCTGARTLARDVARSNACKRDGSCRVRRFTCLLARAGKELTLVRCENSRQTAFVRFELGS